MVVGKSSAVIFDHRGQGINLFFHYHSVPFALIFQLIEVKMKLVDFISKSFVVLTCIVVD